MANGEMAKWRSSEMANGEMAKWRSSEMAKWQTTDVKCSSQQSRSTRDGQRGAKGRHSLFRYSLFALILLLNACGGGGGLGPVAILQGRVVMVGTGLPPNPAATVEAGGVRATTDTQEGTFRIAVPPATTQLVVRAQGIPEPFTFRLPSLQAGQTYDLGDLYIGPERVAVRGRVVDAITQNPVEGAIVSLLGQRAQSDSNGRFTLNDVAYDPNGILDPEGTVQRTGYLQRRFLVDQPPIQGEIELGDIPLQPETDDNPPNTPGNVQGIVQVPNEPVVGTRIDIFSPPDAEFPNESVVITRESGEFRL
ncbi:MAG: carboxypeptidase-like regulatory domain-containing protein, partial [Fimbriimonadales bacterium]|nr:carboxypeptidase-like regulatory domain-containing protein [Fimbriimonadales bacterium]